MAPISDIEPGAPASALEGAVCAIGVFDGVHLGHRLVIDQAVEAARQAGASAAVVTFDVDPDELFSAGGLKKIQSNRERIEMLATLPVDAVAVVPFTRSFASLPPMDFLNGLLSASGVSGVVVGDDFRFGCKAAGDVGLLREWGREVGVAVQTVGLLDVGGVPAKSSNIRRFLEEGDLDKANMLLGRRYSYAGCVRKGRGQGSGMGFATANLDVPYDRRLLADGVYGGYATVAGVRCKAAMSVGIPPTFEAESRDNLEVHLLGFEGDLYGKDVDVEFAKRLRPMKKFDDVDDLIAAVNGDIAWIEQNL